MTGVFFFIGGLMVGVLIAAVIFAGWIFCIWSEDREV